MRLLLDTHIWLWSALESVRLAPGLRLQLIDPANECWLSPISTWEATHLMRKGRVAVDDEIETWLRNATQRFHEAPLTHEIVLAANNLPLPHSDPADRFLAATAQVMDLTLVTADEKLLGFSAFRTIRNR